MTTTTATIPTTIVPTDCPEWCDLRGEPHRAEDWTPEGCWVVHEARVGSWLITAVSDYDSRGTQIRMQVPQVEPEIEWVSVPGDIREVARDLLRAADMIEGLSAPEESVDGSDASMADIHRVARALGVSASDLVAYAGH